VIEDLIYDVGMYDGSDTAYYLHRGYRVVDIEANPRLVDAARLRFAEAVDSGRLHLLNVAIHETPGLDLRFWISEAATCSSFSEGVATKYGRATPTAVRTESFSRVLATHGVPKYLKIDIETLDDACIAALDRRDLPQYVSIEAQPDGPETSLVELRRLGYKRFKIIEQGEFQPLVRYRITRKHPFAYLLPRLRDRLFSAVRPLPADWSFTLDSSGPLPWETSGRWQSLGELQKDWRRWLPLMDDPIANPERSYRPWWDFHASL
jgi:FkbM family methyltransferase